jgi:hypothetical protein
MPSQPEPFSAEYSKGFEPTQVDKGKVEQDLSQTTATEPLVAKPVIETKIYGTGKPRRVVIRGKISS